MGKYKYRIMNSDGEKIDGTYEANSREEVIDYIASNGYYPLLVEEVIESKNIEFKFEKRVKVKDIAIFCRQFYTMLNAGVPILTCLDILSNQIVNEKLSKAVKAVSDDVERGEILSDSMKKHEEVFPNFLTTVVTAGEASGNLETIMLRLSDNYEKENKVNNKVRNAMIYPTFLSLVAVTSVMFILVYVMPTVMQIFSESGTQLPWMTKLLIRVSSGIQNNWILLIFLLVLIILGISIFSKTDHGILFFSKLKLKFPLVKKVTQMLIVSRFTRTLSILLGSGLPLVDSLEIIARISGNKIVEDAMINIKNDVMRGESLYSSMKQSKVFPPMLYSMIKIGEETGALEGILNKTADFYDEELDSTIQNAVSLLEPILIIIMGLVIAFLVMSIMVPLFDSYSQI
ncbi:MAG TPA: type II secretion system protein F [Clostridium sp.]|nr:type II secretion system protein F [Clostridium sp.]